MTEVWLKELDRHAIFQDTVKNSKNESIESTSKAYCMGLNDTYLFVWMHGEEHIRYLCLKEYKKRKESELASVSETGLDYGWIEMDQGWIKSAEDEIDTCHSIKIHSSNRMMILVGKRKTKMVVLPEYYQLQKYGVVKCRDVWIGEEDRNMSGSTLIRKVMWHPLSWEGTHCLILTEDNVLKMYNMVKSPSIAEQTYYLTRKRLMKEKRVGGLKTLASPFKNRFSLKDYLDDDDDDDNDNDIVAQEEAYDEEDEIEKGNYGRSPYSLREKKKVVSFCCGSSESHGWESMTLYYMMKNGDIYSICPVIPQEGIIGIDQYKGLLEKTEQRYSKLKKQLEEERVYTGFFQKDLGKYGDQHPSNNKKQDDVEDEDEEDGFNEEEFDEQTIMNDEQKMILYSLQLQFLKALQIKYTQGEHALFHISSHGRHAIFDMVPARQGPYLLKPAPLELEIEQSLQDNNARDLMILPTTPSILVIGYSFGKVDVALILKEIKAGWVTQEMVETDFPLPVLTMYETLDLSLKSKEHSVHFEFYADELYDDTVYCCHDEGAHSLIFSWIHRLDDALNNSSAEHPLDMDLLEKCPATEIALIIHTDTPSNRVQSLHIINDPYLGYALLALTYASQLLTFELCLRTDLFSLNLVETLGETISSKETSNASSLFTSPLASRPFEQIYKNLLQTFLTSSGLLKLSKPVLDPHLANARYSDTMSENEIKFLTDSMEKLRQNYIRILFHLHREFHDRLHLLEKETVHQNSQLANLDISFQHCFEDQKSLVARLTRSNEKHEELMQKADLILQSLSHFKQTELSSAERDYHHDLQRIQKLVENSFRPRIKHFASVVKEFQKTLSTTLATRKESFSTPTSPVTAATSASNLSPRSTFLANTRRSTPLKSTLSPSKPSYDISTPLRSLPVPLLGTQQQQTIESILKEDTQLITTMLEQLKSLQG